MWEKYGTIKPEKIGGSLPKKLLPSVVDAILEMKQNNPDINISQIQKSLLEQSVCNLSTLPCISAISKYKFLLLSPGGRFTVPINFRVWRKKRKLNQSNSFVLRVPTPSAGKISNANREEVESDKNSHVQLLTNSNDQTNLESHDDTITSPLSDGSVSQQEENLECFERFLDSLLHFNDDVDYNEYLEGFDFKSL